MSNVSSNIAGAMKATKENEEALKEIGITINNDGTINLNEKKLQTAEFDKIKDIFDGNKAMSYGSKVASRLNRASYYVSSGTSTASTDSTSASAVTTSNSKNLMESISNIKSDALFAKNTDKDGKVTYNTEGILSEAENFIKYYNATLTSSKNSSISGVTSVLPQTGSSAPEDSECSQRKRMTRSLSRSSLQIDLTQIPRHCRSSAL